uniref:Reverse transcriptase domain-containing protein n=1 Tax=Fagus sylvatica TaxID=28930 RepID=A0A2N9FNM3_FAGSY
MPKQWIPKKNKENVLKDPHREVKPAAIIGSALPNAPQHGGKAKAALGRGLNHPMKQREVRKMVKRLDLSLICLVETRVRLENTHEVRESILPGWEFVFCCSDNGLGKIWLFWKKEMLDLHVFQKLPQVIHCKISYGILNYYCSFVYASNDGIVRRELWHSLDCFRKTFAQSPWLVAGDFNVVKSPNEKLGGCILSGYENEFLQCVNSFEVDDYPAIGCFFTWSNKRDEDQFTAKKLDRVLVNNDWLCNHNHCIVEFLPPGVSDHSPALISFRNRKNFGPKPFKFFNYWCEHHDFESWIAKAWEGDARGTPMFRLYSKLKATKTKLRSVNKDLYGGISQRVELIRDKLEICQSQLLRGVDITRNSSLEQELLHEFTSISNAEEAFFKQKSRNKWLNLGDQNNTYFHNLVKVRQAKATIKCLVDEDGRRFDNPEDLKQLVVSFYKNLLGSATEVHEQHMIQTVTGLFQDEMPEDIKCRLKQPVSNKEIKDVIFGMGNDKAPGPDGFTALFFKKSWPIIHGSVTEAIRSFFISGKLLKEVNSTIISLIPKVPNPTTVSDFRPIACCNVIYKCITKILANRLQIYLGSLVSSNQSAFIKGRSISENILLAHELVRNYHSSRGSSRCAIKADLRKAYDSVDWNFILMCLLAAGCPPKFVNWIKECITNSRFTISLNGSLVGYFPGGKGLRQGDPISPYLFVIAMEGFTRLLKRRVLEFRNFKFHPQCKQLQITHLSFADDLLLFSSADLPSIRLIKSVLEEFKDISGLALNPNKSEVFFAAVPGEIKEQILSCLQFKEGNLPVRYLGMPLISGKLTYKDCQPLIDKIVGRIHTWSAKHLSFAGRLQIVPWGWRTLLKLREDARLFLKYEVGDGRKIFLWHDHWHPDGILYLKYGHRVVYDAASRSDARVASVLKDQEWQWRPARSEELVSIQSKLCLITLGEEDRAVWSASSSGKFSCAATWNELRSKGNEEDLLEWGVVHLKGTEMRAIVCKVAWWATVYSLWSQRNAIIHAGQIKSEDQLLNIIKRDVKNRLHSKNGFRDTILNRILCCNWGISVAGVLRRDVV